MSLGVVVLDVTFRIARMYPFWPHDVQRVYGEPFSDISVTEKYDEMVGGKRKGGTKINARAFFPTLTEIQVESGYLYIVFEDAVNRAKPIAARIGTSNRNSEVLQVN